MKASSINIVILSCFCLLIWIGCSKDKTIAPALLTHPEVQTDIDDKNGHNNGSRDNEDEEELRLLLWNCNGEPGCPSPDPLCDLTGGNCLPDVIIEAEQTKAFSQFNLLLGEARFIPQQLFFQKHLYSDVFGIPHDDKIQKKLTSGKLCFVLQNDQPGLAYYYAIKPQHTEQFSGAALLQHVKLVIPVVK